MSVTTVIPVTDTTLPPDPSPRAVSRDRIPLRRVPSPRHPALLLAVLLALGVILGDRLAWEPLTWGLSAVVILGLAAFGHRHLSAHVVSVLAMAGTLVAIGGWRIAVENEGRPAPALIELSESARPVESFGRLAGVPYQKRSGWRAPFDLYALRGPAGVVPMRARLLLNTRQPLTGFRHGDYVRLTARFRLPPVRRNPGGFDYAAYLHRQGIDGLVYPLGTPERISPPGSGVHPANWIEPVRRWIRHSLGTFLPARAQALLLGFLLGDTDRLSADVFQAFRESGTLHLLAVSGANVWLMVGMVLLPLRLLAIPRLWRTVILLFVVLAFSFLTRNEPSVMRAALVVGMILLGQLFHRPVHVLNAIGAAGAIILLVSPAHLFWPGFQLSFAAVLAIAVVIRRYRDWKRRHPGRWLHKPGVLVLSSTAASFATAPIVASHFGTVPIMGVLANLAMIPLAAIVTQFGAVHLALVSVWPRAAELSALPLAWLIDSTVSVAGVFSELPGAVVAWPNPEWWHIALWYGVGILILSWRHRYRWMRPVSYGGVAAAALAVTTGYIAAPQPAVTLALLDTSSPRVGALADERGHAIWIADDPGIDDDLVQWVVEPFARTWWAGGAPDAWMDWRRLPNRQASSDSEALGLVSDAPVVWRRYTSLLEGTGDASRLWADRITSGSDTLLLFRDKPDADVQTQWPAGQVGSGQTLILPAKAQKVWLRAMLDDLRPSRAIFYGQRRRRSHPDQTLAFWRIRYPQTEFWSTDVHGGLVVEFHVAGLRILPTVSETSR